MIHLIILTLALANLSPATMFVAVSESDPCPPVTGIDPNEMPSWWLSFNYNDANDIILPLVPDKPGVWDLPTGLYTRKPMSACDDSGDKFKIEVRYTIGLRVKPSVVYEPEKATWSPTIQIPQGLWLAVFRATDFDPNEPKYQDYILCGRGVRVNQPPVLH